MSINLARFQKPSRYIGNEVNIIRKDADVHPVRKVGKDLPSNGVKIALCFPDTYEIGMSHLGLKILYSIINSIPYASAERVFAPWVDYESFLREKRLFLSSLENNLPLKDFDIVGFTLQYELSYTNVLNMLDLGGMPVRANDRGDNYPLIIAGGPCTANPLPLIPFIDAFIIGDGEEIIGEIIEIYKNFNFQNKRFKSKRPRNRVVPTFAVGIDSYRETRFGTKENLLKELSKLEGVYVPSVHNTDKDRIKKRIVKNLDKAPFPEMPAVPFTSIVHDRVAVEISRGCSKGCRFCQAGMTYRPLRERSMENILSIAQKSISNTGYEEISFTSLSTGDYSNLLSLIRTFNNLCSDAHIAISLPSLRVGAVSRDLLKEIKSVRKTGFTIAPEAGTKRLRDIINKDFTEEEYENTLEKLFTEGWQNIKLYFMIGLPAETQEDIDGIIHMAETALQRGRKFTGKRVNINVGISVFVPKPHTPFQWLGQMSFEELRAKQGFIRNALKKKGVNFKGQHVELSLLEAVFAKGDRDCALLLETAWRDGCRFDSWSEIFDFDKWLAASEKTGIDLYKYASRTLDFKTVLPWEFVDIGITGKFLKSEYQKAMQGETTSDCKLICCGCGLECHEEPEKERNGDTVSPHPRFSVSPIHSSKVVTHQLNSEKIRVKFSKTGTLRYLSHREVITALLRAIRRARIPLIYSEGFHPHPKISFGPALPVGIEGTNEYFDIELPTSINPHYFALRSNAVGVNTSDILSKLNSTLPEGLEILAAAHITKNKKSLDNFISRYEYKITIDKATYTSINYFLGLPNRLITRGEKVVDLKPMVEKAEINNGYLRLILVDTDGTKVRLYEILKELFQKSIEEIQTIPIKRVRLYGYSNEGWMNPLESEKTWLPR